MNDTTLPLFIDDAQDAIRVTALTPEDEPGLRALTVPWHSKWLEATGYKTKPGKLALLPGQDGTIERALYGIGGPRNRWAFAALPGQLPAGNWRLDDLPDEEAATRAALAMALGTYRFTRYKRPEEPRPLPRIVWPKGADRAYVTAAFEAIALVRDLVNTPANHMGPAELEQATRDLASRHGASVGTVEGNALAEGYPLIHAVGDGSPRRPRLIDLRWGDEDHPKVTLVGKGVCFDTGGLDIKPPSGMQIMKKDMGGAAHALGLAHMIMALGLKLRLRVLIPAVENAVSGEAMRPLDIIRSRAGLTVEIGDTDAEGRLVLADALTEAVSESPALVLDFATLTGAARVALGPEIPPFFCNHEPTAEALARSSRQQSDPIWRLPLWKGYAGDLDGKLADINNISGTSFAGSIYGALFLQRFVPAEVPWAHFDVYAWNAKSRPGRPEGGEAFALHACLAVLRGMG